MPQEEILCFSVCVKPYMLYYRLVLFLFMPFSYWTFSLSESSVFQTGKAGNIRLDQTL